MLKLVYSADELMASHPFAQFHEAAGHKLHGGFDADGAYTPPRSLNRWPAVLPGRRKSSARDCR